MLNAVHSFFRDLRWSLYQDLEADIHDLRYLFWESTRKCNLNCLHCGSDCGKDSRKGLDARTIVSAFRRIAGAYRAGRIMLVVTGGEPLVRPDLTEIMGEARNLGFVLGMVTNGYTLNEETAQRLYDAGLHSVVVSLDGPEEVHDWLRNRKGSFKRASNAIVSLRRAGVPIVEAITCVTPRSLGLLPRTYEIVRNLDATHWRIFNIFPAGRAKGDPELILTEESIARFVRIIARLREKGKTENLVVNLSEEGYLGWDWEDQVRDSPYFCRAGINVAGIMADGAIAACPNLPPWMNQGNLAEDDFVDVWETRYDIFRDRGWTRQGPCRNCAQWKVCRGNSLHLWDSEAGAPAWCHYKILHP